MSLLPRTIVCLGIVSALVVAVAPSALAQGQGRVVGQVVNEAGDPLEGVTIIAENPNANPPRFETTTGSDGRFAILGLQSGTWNFIAELEGFSPSAGPTQIRQSQNPPVDFELIRQRHALELALGDDALVGLDPDEIDAELQAADAAFNAAEWDTAIATYQSVLEKLPQLSSIHMQIGNAYQQKAEYENAIASYEAVLVDDPGNENVRAAIARSRLSMGDLSAADDLAEAASGLDAAREDLYNLGELEFAKGDVDAAAQWYEKAAMADPTWGKPLFKLALVALNKGDTDGAKEYFQKVVDADPNSEEAVQSQATLAALP